LIALISVRALKIASWPSFAAAGPAVPDAGASSARTMRTMAASDFSSE